MKQIAFLALVVLSLSSCTKEIKRDIWHPNPQFYPVDITLRLDRDEFRWYIASHEVNDRSFLWDDSHINYTFDSVQQTVIKIYYLDPNNLDEPSGSITFYEYLGKGTFDKTVGGVTGKGYWTVINSDGIYKNKLQEVAGELTYSKKLTGPEKYLEFEIDMKGLQEF